MKIKYYIIWFFIKHNVTFLLHYHYIFQVVVIILLKEVCGWINHKKALLAWLILAYKNNCSEGNFKLEKEHITAIFDMVLLINAAYLLLSGLLKDSNIAYNMCLTNLTLYIGFAVSLDDLFDAKNFMGILSCFSSPFSKIKINKRIWLIIGTVAFSIVLFQILCAYIIPLIIFYVILIILLLSLILLNFCA